jgi:LmbE family N-acetylglucosaminyl deacetylase
MREPGAELGFLVVTRGECGRGVLDESAPAVVADIRSQEMAEAAALFDATLMFADLPDATGNEPEQVLRAWSRAAGGRRALKKRFRSLIEQFRPDHIVTFDRHHGCTWHADHRAVASLVQSLALPIPITLAHSRTDFTGPRRFVPGTPRAECVDVRDTWHYLLRDLECHRSQFTEDAIRFFRDAPEAERLVWLEHRARWWPWDHQLGNAVRMWHRAKSRLHQLIQRDR